MKHGSLPGASLGAIAQKLQLKNYTPRIDLANRIVTVMDVNRPALQLYGFYEHFEAARIQIIGMVESAYINTVTDPDKRYKMYARLLSYDDLPCIIFCRDFQPDSVFLELAHSRGIPVLGTFKQTSEFMAELISLLSFELAPSITVHGVLVDVYGVGVLIMGESGVGKSEAALELIRRGHRLVSDDVVNIKRIDYSTLIGTSPDVTKHFIELRGVGIIDVKSLFGVECVKDRQQLDLVIRLEDWDQEKQYDRLGLKEKYHDILGIKLICNDIPIRPGRNLAVICETAAVNFRQKTMGYNAADELDRRVREHMKK